MARFLAFSRYAGFGVFCGTLANARDLYHATQKNSLQMKEQLEALAVHDRNIDRTEQEIQMYLERKEKLRLLDNL